jgi:hypothetical protein
MDNSQSRRRGAGFRVRANALTTVTGLIVDSTCPSRNAAPALANSKLFLLPTQN